MRVATNAASASASPAISTCFKRDLPPCTTDTDDGGTSQPRRDQPLKRRICAAAFRQCADARP